MASKCSLPVHRMLALMLLGAIHVAGQASPYTQELVTVLRGSGNNESASLILLVRGHAAVL